MSDYRILQHGEIIKEGDETDRCADPWRDDPVWEPAGNIGEPAPDPKYPSHRIYRRKTEEAKLRERIADLESGIACCIDRLNTWCRESGLPEYDGKFTEPDKVAQHIDMMHGEINRKCFEEQSNGQ